MTLIIRDLADDEAAALGRLAVAAYAGLEGFPGPAEQPGYYAMLADIGRFARKPDARVLVARTMAGELAGGVVYFGDMAQYGSQGSATQLRNASGIRLLAVDPAFRGRGVGRALTNACIELARRMQHAQVILHTTQAMTAAWALYERMGFERYPAIDFMQEALPVYGFRLPLDA